MKTILALRLDDPANLREQLGEVDIYAAHWSIFQDAVKRFRGQESERPDAPPFFACFGKEELALQAAVAIQQKTRRSVETKRPARLQCAIAIAHEPVELKGPFRALKGRRRTGRELSERSSYTRERTAEDLIQKDMTRQDMVTGGRIVCTDNVYDEIARPELLYKWQEVVESAPAKFDGTYLWTQMTRPFVAVKRLALGGKLMECLYDDPQSLLNGPFERVFAEEVRGWILPRRLRRARSAGGGRNRDERYLPYPERPHPQNDLIGLALSGGGMRSAVFSLGAVQALAHYGVLEDVDYLSTVSGGSYLGAALSALWAEPLPYDDTPQLDATRKLFPFAYPRPPSDGGLRAVHGNESPALKHVRCNAKLFGRGIGLFDSNTWSTAGQFLASMMLLWVIFLLPAATLVVLGGIGVHNGFEHLRPHFDSGDPSWIVIASTPAMLAVLALALSLARLRTFSLVCAIAAAILFVLEVFGTVTLQHGMAAVWKDHWQVTLAALSPLLLFSFYSVISVMANASSSGRGLGVLDPVGSALLPTAAALTFVLLLCAGIWGFGQLWNGTAGPYIAGATGLWSASVAGISLSKLWDAHLKDNKNVQRAIWLIALAIGGYIVLGLGLSGWSWFLWRSAEAHPWWVFGCGSPVAGIITVCTLYHPLSRGLLNYFSLNRAYATMIQNTWVVGARPPGLSGLSIEPVGAPWTQVWPRPDITMGMLRNEVMSGDGPSGPYHLVCTALNLPGSTSDKLLDRQSDSFVIAPLYSGSALTRWINTQDHFTLNVMPLAEAAAISGAAISPNMGAHTTRTLSIVLTLLNVRLGRWLRNPRPSTNAPLKKVLTDSPLALYWKEMFGLASHEDGQIYLSDGGHFENLGLYELLRRRCKYIIAISADVGPVNQAFDMGNLGAALRLARVDFGVEAELGPLTTVMHDPNTGEVKSFFTAGDIKYPNGGPEDKGILIFIKTGIIEGDLSADLLNYWKNEHPAFPYDSTTNQQFDQPQFESYRQLGYIATHATFKSLGKQGLASTRERLKAIAAIHTTPRENVSGRST